MLEASTRYTLLKFLLLTQFLLCEEFDIALMLEELESLAEKVELQTRMKHEEIANVITKLEILMRKTQNMFSASEVYRSERNGSQRNMCEEKCRERKNLDKNKIFVDFIHELGETIKKEKNINLLLRNDLRDFSDDAITDLSDREKIPFRNRLLSLVAKLDESDLKIDSYVTRLRKNEEYIEASITTGRTRNSYGFRPNYVAGVTPLHDFKYVLVNDSIKVLNEEIFSVQQEIDLTVKRIHRKPLFFP